MRQLGLLVSSLCLISVSAFAQVYTGDLKLQTNGPSMKTLYVGHLDIKSNGGLASTVDNFTITLRPSIDVTGRRFTSVTLDYDIYNRSRDNPNIGGNYGADFTLIYHDMNGKELSNDRSRNSFSRGLCSHNSVQDHKTLDLGPLRPGLFDEAGGARLYYAGADNDTNCP